MIVLMKLVAVIIVVVEVALDLRATTSKAVQVPAVPTVATENRARPLKDLVQLICRIITQNTTIRTIFTPRSFTQDWICAHLH